MQDLRDRGLIDRQLPFDDEVHYRGRLFIEYFQALEHEGILGAMQGVSESDADYRARMRPSTLDGNLALRLADRPAIAGLGGAPFVVRVVLFAGARRYERMTAVRGEVF